MAQSPFDPETHYFLERSQSPRSVDGYRQEEPKRLVCEECGANVRLTEQPSAGVDELGHDPTCPQRYAKSRWWRERFLSE
jgi:hypothetical protein